MKEQEPKSTTEVWKKRLIYGGIVAGIIGLLALVLGA